MKRHQPIGTRDLFLVRHGLSESNLDISVNRRTADHAIELAPEGHRQAIEAGKRIAAHLAAQRDQLAKAFPERDDQIPKIRLMISPYQRTRQTAAGIIAGLDAEGIEYSRREHVSLRESNFGLFDGLRDEELPEVFPLEYAHYKKHLDVEGSYYAPMPMGESWAMVTDRIHTVFGTILRDFQMDDPITTTIVVSHGITLRCFRMAWFHRPWEWAEKEPNPHNCSVMQISGSPGNWTESQFFAGFKHRKANSQDRREDGNIA